MKKKLLCTVFVVGIFATIFCAGNTFALETEGLNLIKPAVDLDFVILSKNQTKTVTADLSFPFDFEIVPVYLLSGDGNLSISLSKTDTIGELIYVGFYGFGEPTSDINIGVTPITLKLNSSVSEHLSYGIGIIVHGILFSLEDPPYEYKMTLSY